MKKSKQLNSQWQDGARNALVSYGVSFTPKNICITLHPPIVILRVVAESMRHLDSATTLRVALQ
jgi:hypothetical protein